MAIEGLFSARAAIFKKVRKVELSITSGVEDTSLQQVRVFIYSELGIELVTTILTYAEVENPSTEEELIRMTAINLEVNKVNIALLRRLPIATLTEADDSRELFNDDPISREAYDLAKHLDWLEEQVEQDLKALVELKEGSDENDRKPRWVIF